MRFEWDSNKSERNLEKHGVRFDDAAPLFVQPHCYTCLSGNRGTDTQRYVRVGKLKGKLFAAVFTIRGETIRIICGKESTE